MWVPLGQPPSLFMTDGDPDVFLTASHLRDMLRRMLFVKTAPVYISPSMYEIFKYFCINTYCHMQFWRHLNLVILVPNKHLIKCERDSILNQTANSLSFNVTYVWIDIQPYQKRISFKAWRLNAILRLQTPWRISSLSHFMLCAHETCYQHTAIFL